MEIFESEFDTLLVIRPGTTRLSTTFVPNVSYPLDCLYRLYFVLFCFLSYVSTLFFEPV